jgi:ssDNA-binding Zn-finger/Zn-ribbon topoisomerase 1
MSWILIAAIILIIIAFVFVKFLQSGMSASVNYPYQSAGPLFTPAERSFYGVLNQAVGSSATVFGKVRVADIAIPKKGLSRSEWQTAFNKVSAKHFDFILCNNNDLSVVCAIELDDSSHKSEKRQTRDEFLKGVCSAANVPLIQIPAKAAYVLSDIHALLAPYLNDAEPKEQQVNGSEKHSDSREKSCPKCASLMVVRVAKNGSNVGKQFWACSAYPKCRHIEAINT